jgi:hypothetical protein
MILHLSSKSRMHTTLLAALAGGLLGGALVPASSLAANDGNLGALASRAIFAAVAAAVILAARGAPALGGRVAIAAAAGLLAACLEGVLPTGSSPAVLGLGLALVLAPEGRLEGVPARVLRASGGALGALVAAVLLGEAAALARGVSPIAWDALLGAGLAIGATAGELLNQLVFVSARPPRELDAARKDLSADGRATVDLARGAYVRACEAILAATSLDAADRVEALGTARELALAATRSSVAADEIARAKANVHVGVARVSEEVRVARERVSEQLERKLTRAREDGARAATALAELGLAIAERQGVPGPDAAELEARVRGLAFRLGAPAAPPADAKG